MGARIADLAKAITTELTAEEFSQDFDAEFAYRPKFDLPDMDTLHVTVVPSGLTRTIDTRSKTQNDDRIDVGIQQRALTDEALDALMALVEELADWCERRMFDSPKAVCIRVENDPIYDPTFLQEMKVFCSVLTLTFRWWK